MCLLIVSRKGWEMERITIEEAAKLMGMSKQAVRLLMINKKVDIGFVTGDGRKNYVIFREKLNKLMGKETS